jgi:hypothetical protein
MNRLLAYLQPDQAAATPSYPSGLDPSSNPMGALLTRLQQGSATPGAGLTLATGATGAGGSPDQSGAPPTPQPPRAAATPGAALALSPAQQAHNVGAARDAMSNPEVFAFMQALSPGEGDYDQLNGGGRFSGWSYPGAGVAAGAYGIMPTTYEGLKKQLGLTDFSPDTQDVMTAHLIASRGAVPSLVNGNLQEAIGKLRGTWPSLPGGTQPNIHTNSFVDRYNNNLKQLMGQ